MRPTGREHPRPAGRPERRLRVCLGHMPLVAKCDVARPYDPAAGSCEYFAVAKTPRAWVPSASRQVADRHGRPASPAAGVPSPDWRILWIRTRSWPFRLRSAATVRIRRSVPNGPLAATVNPAVTREPPATGWLITVRSGVLLRLWACG